MLRDELGWQIEPQNIALTNGSQSAFFYLFNLFAGRYADGSRRRVLFPLAPGIWAMRMQVWMKIYLSPPNRILSCYPRAV